MPRPLVMTLLALGLTVTTAPAMSAVYCKSVGVPKGCVARPVPVAPVVRAPAAAVAAPRPGNLNGGVNRVGRLR